MDLSPVLAVAFGLEDEVLADAVDGRNGPMEEVALEVRDRVPPEEVGEDGLPGPEVQALVVDERPTVERGVQLLPLLLDFDDLRHQDWTGP